MYYHDSTHKTFHALGKLFKAEVPPDWWMDAQQLNSLLRGSWANVSRSFSAQVKDAVSSGKFDQADDLLKTIDSLGVNMSAALGDQPQAIFAALLSKSEAAWTLHGKETLAVQRIEKYDGDYRRFLADVHAEQIKKFTELNPGRILHPEIQRQIDYLKAPGTRSIDLDIMAERMGRTIKQDGYWEGLSDVHVARLWHSDGILFADQNGVVECYIAGPDDQRTCPVCQRMVGQRFLVSDARAKIDRDIGITDPDKYVAAWKFPRIQDVDNISQEQLQKKGYLPPLHSRCRHSVAWFTRGASTVQVPGQIAGADAASGKVLAKGFIQREGYVELVPPEPFKTKEDAQKWMQGNIAGIVEIGKSRSIREINESLATIRRMKENGVKLPILHKFDWTQKLRNKGGDFSPGDVRINSIVKGSNRYSSIEEIRKTQLTDAELRVKMYEKSYVQATERYANSQSSFDKNIAGAYQKKAESARSNVEILKKSDLRYNQTAATWGYQSDADGLIIHEEGHNWHFWNRDKVEKETGLKWSNESAPKGLRTTDYSTKNHKEAFAEAFTAYMAGAVKHIPTELVNFFDKEFPNLAFGKKILGA